MLPCVHMHSWVKHLVIMYKDDQKKFYCVLPLVSLGKRVPSHCYLHSYATKDVYYFKHVKDRALSMGCLFFYMFICRFFFRGGVGVRRQISSYLPLLWGICYSKSLYHPCNNYFQVKHWYGMLACVRLHSSTPSYACHDEQQCLVMCFMKFVVSVCVLIH